MSEAPAEGTATQDELALPQGDAAFGELMDFLVGEADGAPAGEGGEQAPAAGAGDGQAAAEGEGAAKPQGDAPAPPAGDAGKPAVPGDGTGGGVEGDASTAAAGTGGDGGEAEPGGGDRPADWTRSSAELLPAFGELSTKLEDKVARTHHEASLAEVREEHSGYFEALEKHPRLLIGTEVPKLDGSEGMEVLRDAADAAEWQEAAKSLLVQEVRDRASKAIEDSSDLLTTVHQSIELFQNNADLIPGTKDFDVELANEFSELMKPYEARDDEKKLLGYSIPVQPIINKLRSDLAAKRAAKPEAPAAPASSNDSPGSPAQQAPAKQEDPPQAGISSKAGESSDKDDFSTLFGTISPELRDMRI